MYVQAVHGFRFYIRYRKCLQNSRLVYVLGSRPVEERLFDVRYQSTGGAREASVQESSPSLLEQTCTLAVRRPCGMCTIL